MIGTGFALGPIGVVHRDDERGPTSRRLRHENYLGAPKRDSTACMTVAWGFCRQKLLTLSP
jgi:hypothetical protein